MNNFKLGSTESLKGAAVNVKELDITKNVLLLLPYGMQMNLPDYPLMAITGKLESQGDNQFTFVTDPVNRDSNLDTGEVSFGIPKLTARITFKKDGSVVIKDKTGNVVTMDEEGISLNDTNGNELILAPSGSKAVIGQTPNPIVGFCNIQNCLWLGAPHTSNIMKNE